MASRKRVEHARNSYDPGGEIARALNAPLPPERERIQPSLNLPANRPAPMFGLRPAPRFAKAAKSEAWQRRATDDGDD